MLVRPEYLVQLHREERVWPRRPEAEREPGALCRPAEGEYFRFIGISHAWESREHPDPCGFQLAQIVRRIQWQQEHEFNFFDDRWWGVYPVFFFIDFLSLYQYKCDQPGQEEAFRHAMTAMHLCYANSDSEFCLGVWRIERLTPPRCLRRQIKQGRTLSVYREGTGRVEEVGIADLVHNATPYAERGWCCAEVEWSKPNSTDISERDGLAAWFDPPSSYLGLGPRLYCLCMICRMHFPPASTVPLTPSAFSEQATGLQFTHRSDMEPVLRLQKLVFEERMSSTEEVKLQRLPLRQIPSLLEVVPLYECLREFRLRYQYLSPTDGETLLRLLLVKPSLKSLKFFCVPLPSSAMRVFRDGGLAVSSLRTVEFAFCNLGDTSAELLADGVATSTTLKDLDLTANSVRNRGAVALAHALRASTCRLKKLTLNHNRIGSAGVLALHAATVGPRRIQICLGGNPVGWQARHLSETHISVDVHGFDRLYNGLAFPLAALEHWRQRLDFAFQQLRNDFRWIASAALAAPLLV